jgi:CubicO group peptidase (beta-lactamase class C family)
MAWRRRILVGVGGLVALFVAVMAAWAVAIGPEAVWRILRHGTTTVWDHTEYPGRSIAVSADSQPWNVLPVDEIEIPSIDIEGETWELGDVLQRHDTLAFVIIEDGALAYEWYRDDHGPAIPSMLFSVSKSVTSLLVGAAIHDGLIGSVADPVTAYIPELADRGFDRVTVEDLLRMDSELDYIEDDNPFGIHVEFNYTADLEGDILDLELRDEPDQVFRYKSGDNAVLGLLLDRALGNTSITDYLDTRLLAQMGSEHGGVWSTDDVDGLERTWCCLALTARDVARFGQLILNQGSWNNEQLVPSDYLEASFTPAYRADAWPPDYENSLLTSYGYQWWLIGEEAIVAFGKDGQYLYVHPNHNVVIVRLGESQGGIGWIDILHQIAVSASVR